MNNVNPCYVQIDFDTQRDNELQAILDSIRTVMCAGCQSWLYSPDDHGKLQEAKQLDTQGEVNLDDWKPVVTRVRDRPYCACCHRMGRANGKRCEGAVYHEKLRRREFYESRKLAGVA